MAQVREPSYTVARSETSDDGQTWTVVEKYTYSSASEAWWDMIRQAGLTDSIASPQTMDYLRDRLDEGQNVFCNGYQITVSR